MGKATQLREELLEMGVQISHVHLTILNRKIMQSLSQAAFYQLAFRLLSCIFLAIVSTTTYILILLK